jgi:hypothetical protein
VVKPFFEILHFDDVGNFRLPDLDGHGREPFTDFTHPFMAVQGGEGLRHSFVERP